MPEPPRPSRSTSRVAIVVGFAISVAAVAFLFWRVSFRDLGKALATADLVWLLPALGVFFVMFALRSWRWALLLGGTPFVTTWHANVIGYMFNCALPLRLGEVARAYVIGKATNVRMARALSAVLVERIIDLSAVVLMFAGFSQLVPMRASFTRAAKLGSAAVVACVIGGIVLVKVEAIEHRIVAPLLRRAGEARAESWLRRFRDIREGFRAIGSGKRLAQAIVLTALVWGTTIVLAAACMRAFFPGETNMTRAGLLVVMANLGGALPSAPGGLGIVQGFATSALVVPFGLDEGRALACALVWSLSQQLILPLLGLFSMARMGLRFGEIRAGAASDS